MRCDWPVDDTCLPDLPAVSDPPEPGEEDELEAAQLRRDDAVEQAKDVLWALSGQQFGRCPVIYRPCPPSPARRAFGVDYPRSVLFDGTSWVEAGCSCRSACRRSGPARLHLPGPVGEILDVTIHDTVLDPSEYRLEGNYLYRLGEGAKWPSQDLGKPSGYPGTWSVRYTKGTPPPSGAGRMVGQLAREFLAACGGGKCRLPRNVSTITRNGVTYQVYDSRDMHAAKKTGIPDVDLWLASVNPDKLSRPPTVR